MTLLYFIYVPGGSLKSLLNSLMPVTCTVYAAFNHLKKIEVQASRMKFNGMAIFNAVSLTSPRVRDTLRNTPPLLLHIVSTPTSIPLFKTTLSSALSEPTTYTLHCKAVPYR